MMDIEYVRPVSVPARGGLSLPLELVADDQASPPVPLSHGHKFAAKCLVSSSILPLRDHSESNTELTYQKLRRIARSRIFGSSSKLM